MQIAAYQLPMRRPRLAKGKVCYKCPENGEQPFDNFYKNSTKCKKCYREDYQKSKLHVVGLCAAARVKEIERLKDIIDKHLTFYSLPSNHHSKK